ncbi:MAG: ABC transporter permease, partial [Aeromonas bestiarum]
MMPATTRIAADQPVKILHGARRHWLPALVLLPFILLMMLFQLAPMVWVLVGSFQTPDGWGIDHYREILSSPFYLQSFTNS